MLKLRVFLVCIICLQSVVACAAQKENEKQFTGSATHAVAPCKTIQQWCRIDIPGLEKADFYDAWSDARGHVWAVGSGGASVYFDGTAWRVLPQLSGNALLEVAGNDRHVFAVGLEGTLLQWEGDAWALRDTEFADYDFEHIVATDVNTFYLSGRKTINGVDTAIILRFEENTWRLAWHSETSALKSKSVFISDMCSTGTEDVVVTGGFGREPNALYLHSINKQFVAYSSENTTSEYPVRCASGAHDAVAINTSGSDLRRMGNQELIPIDFHCSAQTCNAPFNSAFVSLWYAQNGRGFAASDKLLEFDLKGSRLVGFPVAQTLFAINGSDQNLFAVGANGYILHFDGRTWSEQISTTRANLNTLVILRDRIFSAGDHGTILQYLLGAQ